MFGASFDVATAMHAVGIMENAVLSMHPQADAKDGSVVIITKLS